MNFSPSKKKKKKTRGEEKKTSHKNGFLKA